MAINNFHAGVAPYANPYIQQDKIVLAPDALVFIYGEDEIEHCINCRQKKNFQKDIVNIQVDLGVDKSPGSASFTIAAPRHDPERYIKNGRIAFQPMMEVNIYMKGRYLANTTREPQYYHVFWGLISSVTLGYSDGVHTINVQCDDILRIWQLMIVNTHPALTNIPNPTNVGGNKSIFSMKSPHEIIYELANDVRLTYNQTPTGVNFKSNNDESMTVPNLSDSRNQKGFKNSANSGDEMAPESNIFPSYKLHDWNRIIWWEARQLQIKRNVRIFGYNPEQIEQLIAGRRLRSDEPSSKSDAAIDETNFIRFRSLELAQIEKFNPYYGFGQFDFFEDIISTKLDIAQEVAKVACYEFYMDVTGEIIFKPPFYNLEVKDHTPSVIKDIDIISQNFTVNEKEIFATRMDIQGTIFGSLQQGDSDMDVRASYINYSLISKFGYRVVHEPMRMFIDPATCFNYAVGRMDIANKNFYSGSVTILGRPELKLGYPIFIENMDAYFYVQNITHSFTFGDSYTTTLTLCAGRKRVYINDDRFKSFEEIVPEAASYFNSDVYKIKYTPGLVNKGLQHKSQYPILDDTDQIKNLEKQIQKLNSKPNTQQDSRDKTQLAMLQKTLKSARDIANKKYIYAGTSDAASKNIASIPTDIHYQSDREHDNKVHGTVPTNYILSQDFGFYLLNNAYDILTEATSLSPVSDLDGYEVFGTLPYGRNLALDSSGTLVDNTNVNAFKITKLLQNNQLKEFFLNFLPNFAKTATENSKDLDLLALQFLKETSSALGFILKSASFLANLTTSSDDPSISRAGFVLDSLGLGEIRKMFNLVSGDPKASPKELQKLKPNNRENRFSSFKDCDCPDERTFNKPKQNQPNIPTEEVSFGFNGTSNISTSQQTTINPDGTKTITTLNSSGKVLNIQVVDSDGNVISSDNF